MTTSSPLTQNAAPQSDLSVTICRILATTATLWMGALTPVACPQ